MKQFKWILLSLLIVCTACTKYGNYGDTDITDWAKGGEAYYNKVIDLQTEAGEKYTTWSQTMDSLEAIKKLQQFFQADPSVTSATIGSQGIAVQYSNGMRGGVFLDPQNGSGEGALSSGARENTLKTSTSLNSMVNSRNAICLFSCYWQYEDVLDVIERYYTSRLPYVGMNLTRVYQNTAVTVDRFTELSGYGLIHIDSHGWAWPKDWLILDVYVQTGELINEITAQKYWNDLITGKVIMASALIAKKGIRANCFFLSPRFLASHNDFSKDTVLFFGGFCYSNLGGWPELYKKFLGGGSFGFDWSVHYERQDEWGRSLIDHLCNEQLRPPGNTGDWMAGPLQKWYFDKRNDRNVSIQFAGDPNLTLWEEAEVVTNPVTKVTSTTATGGGNVKSDGGIPITEKGLCWSTSENPTTHDNHTIEVGGTGSFENTLDNLIPFTQYWIRAYATNSSGIFYGKQIPFITEEGGGGDGTFSYDGRTYKFKTIGTQTWMTENLAYLPSVDSAKRRSQTSPCYYVYDYNKSSVSEAKANPNYTTYGVLYNWEAAKTACPTGWHLPSDTEWTILTDYLTNSGYGYGGRPKDIGKSIAATSGWASHSTVGTVGNDQASNNKSGFSALPGGISNGDFNSLGQLANFWSASESDATFALDRELSYGYVSLWRGYNYKFSGFSVRCLKD